MPSSQSLDLNFFNNSESSFPEFPYPALRESLLRDGKEWLKGKTIDDGAEGLWRIHDTLYDFSDFIGSHPGGKEWLLETKGTDITEAFEAHHISTIPEKMLWKFRIREAKKPRNSPFTFKADGFYRTLKGRVREEVKTFPKGLESKSNRIVESLAVSLIILSVLVTRTTWMPLKILLHFLTALCLAWTTIAAHNFLHQKDNWRMYLFNFGFMSFRQWRQTHALSHHLYTNTLWDHEISVIEPFIQWMPRKSKSFTVRYYSMIYVFFIIAFTVDDIVYKRFVRFFFVEEKRIIRKSAIIPLIIPMAMMLFGTSGILMCLLDWMIIVHTGGLVFTSIGIHTAHHHPDVFHDGDKRNENSDWGFHQLRAVIDRVEFTENSFLVLTNFGDHVLHHLFPTLDHAYLPLLYPITRKTCAEFNAEFPMTTNYEMLLGQFKQLAHNKPSEHSKY